MHRPDLLPSKVDAHIAKTIAAKPELVQISTGYGAQKKGSPILPRNKYTVIGPMITKSSFAHGLSVWLATPTECRTVHVSGKSFSKVLKSARSALLFVSGETVEEIILAIANHPIPRSNPCLDLRVFLRLKPDLKSNSFSRMTLPATGHTRGRPPS